MSPSSFNIFIVNQAESLVNVIIWLLLSVSFCPKVITLSGFQYINKNDSSLRITAKPEYQSLFTIDSLTMHILEIFYTLTQS
jgi:hypothetical protein